MTSSVRESLTTATPVVSTHAGLWLDRFLNLRNESVRVKSTHIDSVAIIEAPSGYMDAMKRREQLLLARGGCSFGILFDQKVIPGMSDHGVLEAGVSMEHTWGVPIIVGSTLKGLTRAVSCDIEDVRWHGPAGEYFTTLFGSATGVGAVAFHDAWWEPASEGDRLPIVRDVLTPHYSDYYQKAGRAPDGTEDPVPVPFPVVVAKTSFRVWVTGPQQWCEAAQLLLQHALHDRGVGARTDVGYGRARSDARPGA